MPFQETHILLRLDTHEYLKEFLVFMHEPPQWTSDQNEAFQFKSPWDATLCGRDVLNYIGDPLNKTTRLVQGDIDGIMLPVVTGRVG
jgi:hypothetical protein